MSNNNLMPLVWTDNKALSAIHSYEIKEIKSNDGVKLAVGGKFHVEKIRLATQKKETVTGFSDSEQAKRWSSAHHKAKMQPYVKPDAIRNHFDNFTQWSYDRQIIQNGNTLAQGLKLVSEVGELADNLAKGRDISDDVGDCMVVLNNLVQMTGVTLDGCLAQAWGDIKDRKGTMNEHGVFIKEAIMTNDQIRDIALANGFKLKEQADGSMDLNPYVYDFALKLLNKQNVKLFNDMKTGMHYVSGYGHKQYKEGVNHCLDVIQASNERICSALDERSNTSD